MGNLSIENLTSLTETGEIDTVIVAFPDQYGQLMGKRLAADFFLRNPTAVESCDYLLTADIEMEPLSGFASSGWDQGYGDYRMVPDPGTLRRLAWPASTTLVIADLQKQDGSAVPHAPRSVLRRQCQRTASLGFTPMMASELEFYLFKNSYEDVASGGEVEPSTPIRIDYQILGTQGDEPLFREVRRGIGLAGIPVESHKGETGRGQYEIAIEYDGAMESADRHVVFKYGVKSITLDRGQSVTFMAKYTSADSGSSGHIHTSLYDGEGGANLFWDAKKKGGSTLFDHFLGGLHALSAELFLFFAPTVNSYKRFCAASFAPTRISWGHDNRTTGFRVVGHDRSFRIENRLPRADVNPYLAYAAVLAAGIYGIEHELTAPPAFGGNVYEAEQFERVPASLGEAADKLDRSDRAREIFGDEVVDHYVLHARHEEQTCRDQVTEWERNRYFTRI